MMATLRLRYVHSWHDKKTGRVRYTFRYKARQWPLPGLPGSKEFCAVYDALYQEHIAKREPNIIAYAPATLGGVIEKYLASDSKLGFLRRSPNTQRVYRRILDRLKAVAGRGIMADLREDHVRQIRQKFMPATATADMAVIVLRILWVFAKEELAMQLGANPAVDIRRLHDGAKAYEPWPADVIAKFEDHVRANAIARMAYLLLLYTGQRVGDVAAMKWNQYDGKGIGVRQQKTGTILWIPCHACLKAALDSAPRRSEFIVGKNYSGDGLSNVIRRALRRIGAEQYTTHALRKNATIALIEAGCTPAQAAAITGHRSWRMLQHYAASAEQKKLAKQAIGLLEVAQSRTKRGH
jgi:integrase